MKEKEVINDFKEQQLMIYAEKEDGSITPVQTGSYISKKYIDDFHEMSDRLNNSLTEKLERGEISPVYYFMTLEDISVAEVASRAGLSKSSVRKHLDPAGFKHATVSDLVKYGNVFNIPVANFFQIIKTLEDKKWNMGFHEERDKSLFAQISQSGTQNPIIVETKIVQDIK